ncbi:MAG: hypothetical protein R6U94_02715 [Nitriliruptoraceae bacterium]
MPRVLDPGWLDRSWRALLLTAIALSMLVLPVLGSTPASAAEDAGTTSQPAVPDDLAAALTDDGRVELLFFGSATCPYCQQMEGYLDELEATFSPPLEVSRYEVSGDPAARERWEAALLARGYTPSGVPTAILGDRVWIGFDENVAREVTRAVATVVAAAPAAAGGDVAEDQPPGGDAGEVREPTDTNLSLPVIGEVELAGRSALGITVLIALVDGFNPCSLWVLAILLAMVLNAGATRRRVIVVGTTFLAVTAAIYGAFIVGVFTVVDLLSGVTAITWVVGAIALLVGVVNIKDYFAYKQGLSFTIPDRYKPRIYRGGRAIRDDERPLPAVLLTTVVLAAGVAVVELPCTMGFPVIWTGSLQTMGIGRDVEFAGLLGLYLLVYVGLELVLFGIVVATMQVTRLEERHGRALKLIGGSLMVVLGVAMVWFQTLLDDLTGLLALTLSAAALAGVLVLVNRVRTGGRGGDPAAGDGPTSASSHRSATSGHR